MFTSTQELSGVAASDRDAALERSGGHLQLCHHHAAVEKLASEQGPGGREGCKRVVEPSYPRQGACHAASAVSACTSDEAQTRAAGATQRNINASLKVEKGHSDGRGHWEWNRATKG